MQTRYVRKSSIPIGGILIKFLYLNFGVVFFHVCFFLLFFVGTLFCCDFSVCVFVLYFLFVLFFVVFC